MFDWMRNLRAVVTGSGVLAEWRSNPDGTQSRVLMVPGGDMGGWREVREPYARVGARGGKTSV